jgi:large subunit ribosomal protein L29
LKELEERLENEENMLVRMRMNHAVSPLDNPNKIVETRRNVARLKTEVRARQIKEQSEKQS